jgi:hypothetical protein
MHLVFALLLAELLDNAAVVRMAHAGLSQDVVLTKIAQSQTTFDTSVDALIALKSEGVPDAVIKEMVVKSPSRPTPQPAQPSATSDSACFTVQYYTLAARGWGWTPALLCAGESGIDIDEMNIPYERVTTHCFVLSPLPRADKEWWFSDGADTYKFRTANNDLQSISDLIAHKQSGIPHGSCGDRAVRKLLAPTHE